MIVSLSAAAANPSAIYLPLHCGELSAKVLAVRSDGTADLEILNENGTVMMLLTRIKLHASKDGCRRGEAYLAISSR